MAQEVEVVDRVRVVGEDKDKMALNVKYWISCFTVGKDVSEKNTF